MKPDSIGTFSSQPPVIGTFASANRALLLQPTVVRAQALGRIETSFYII